MISYDSFLGGKFEARGGDCIRMILKSINYWSMPGGLDGTADPTAFLKAAKKHGYDAVELCIAESGALGLDATEARCKGLAAEAASLGLSIPSTASGLYWSRALGDAEESARKQAVDDLVKMLRISSWLGAKTHLTIPGAVNVFFLPDRQRLPYDHVWKYATSGLREALPVAAEVGVRIGIENVWNKFLMSPLEDASIPRSSSRARSSGPTWTSPTCCRSATRSNGSGFSPGRSSESTSRTSGVPWAPWTASWICWRGTSIGPKWSRRWVRSDMRAPLLGR